MPRAPYSQGHCANCGSHRLLKYAHLTMCCRYKCQKAAAAQAGNGAYQEGRGKTDPSRGPGPS